MDFSTTYVISTSSVRFVLSYNRNISEERGSETKNSLKIFISGRKCFFQSKFLPNRLRFSFAAPTRDIRPPINFPNTVRIRKPSTTFPKYTSPTLAFPCPFSMSESKEISNLNKKRIEI